ncbi:threonylcarbamoyl-AMP synthase [Alphaproteobacteria bacterium]|nr:threonylcarbamoyl-AMP synthase [Alphaproteobacteria bacterium]
MLVINENTLESTKIACQFLREGKVIAIPTDTVYGLAVDATNSQAVNRLYQLKKRAIDKPIAIFLKDKNQIKKIFTDNNLLDKISEEYLPGKLTIVSKLRDNLQINLANNLNLNDQNYLGFRIVESFFVKKLFEQFNSVLAVSSANLSGQKVAISADEIIDNFDDVDLVISGKILDNQASTVIKIEGDNYSIIRQGQIKL